MSPRKRKTESIYAWFVPVLAALFLLAGLDIYSAGSGSGHVFAGLSAKWLAVVITYATFAAGTLYFALQLSNKASTRSRFAKRIEQVKRKLGKTRLLLAAFVCISPAIFVFYTGGGALFTGFFVRLLIFIVSIVLASALFAKSAWLDWRGFLTATLITGTFLVLTESLVLVSNFPFALHWSEGNRLWDYSLAFGRDRYNFPSGDEIFVWIDRGRQMLWGLPFLIPNLPIWAARLWNAFLTTVPYALLGWAPFRSTSKLRDQWIAAGLWALLFLNQGPIYTPLVLAAILVAFARKKPIWIALPLVFVAGYYASLARFTWIFAAGIWAALLSLSDEALAQRNLNSRSWLRALVLGFAGIWTRGLPVVLGVLAGLLPGTQPVVSAPVDATPGMQSIETLQGLQATATSQPYAWDRLLPNEIYAPGILIGLLLAALPVIALLVYAIKNGIWKTNRWQRVVLALGSLAFLVVGVIASAKVGGGTDLHNLDMFLITLVLLAGVAWEAGLHKKLADPGSLPRSMRAALAALVLIPAFLPMIEGKPLEIPAADRTEFVLQRIQDKVACARQYGEVLFMDQRQLITFGEVGDLPLVVDYEKKYVMDQALAGNAAYFEQFTQDLSAGRFSLIVGEREAVLYKDANEETIGDALIAENNAWVKWVTTPLLQYYESVADYRDVAVELFMPIGRDFDCP